MKIEAGKFYRTAGGEKAEALRDIGERSQTFEVAVGDQEFYYDMHGAAPGLGQTFDLIAEWTDPAPDYNDGNWHAWTGGDCPVHPYSFVGVQHIGSMVETRRADAIDWDKAPFLFRVREAYQPPKVPLEFWAVQEGPVFVHTAHDTPGAILFREVLK